MKIILNMPEDGDLADLILQTRAAESLAKDYPESRGMIVVYGGEKRFYVKRNGNTSISVRPA